MQKAPFDIDVDVKALPSMSTAALACAASPVSDVFRSTYDWRTRSANCPTVGLAHNYRLLVVSWSLHDGARELPTLEVDLPCICWIELPASARRFGCQQPRLTSALRRHWHWRLYKLSFACARHCQAANNRSKRSSNLPTGLRKALFKCSGCTHAHCNDWITKPSPAALSLHEDHILKSIWRFKDRLV